MKHLYIMLPAIGLAAPFYVNAQLLADTTDYYADTTTYLNECVVTANRVTSLRRTAPSLVGLVNTKTLEAVNSSNIGDALPYQPGLCVEDNCQNCGYKQARINGLDGHYSQILIDSRPIFSAVSNLYGLEQIPANMVERIEVLRGGGSALYGAQAVGGTINIITKDPNENRCEIGHQIRNMGGNDQWDNTTTFNASRQTEDGKVGISLYGQNRKRDGYSYYNDGYTNLPSLKTQSFGTKVKIKTNGQGSLCVNYNFLNDDRRGGNKADERPEKANIAETAQHHMHNGSLNYLWQSEDEKWNFNIYTAIANVNRHSYTGGYGTDENPDPDAAFYYSKTKDMTLMGGATGRRHIKHLWFMPAEFTFGGEYLYNKLEDYALGYHIETDQRATIGSLYLQNEWKNEQWGFLIGGRLDKHNLLEKAIMSPRANIRFSPTTHYTFRLTYSEGFRAPQLFDEDLHISMAAGERKRVENKAGLKEERSHSYSISGVTYQKTGNVKWNLVLEGFLTTLNDVWAEEETGEYDEQNVLIVERYNASGAKVMGLNTELDVTPAQWMDIDCGMTLQRSRYDEAEKWSKNATATRKMWRVPDQYGYLNIGIKPLKKTTIDITGTYTGSMMVQHMASSGTPTDKAVKTPSFFNLNVKAGYTFKLLNSTDLTIEASVENIFNAYQTDLDKGPERDSGYIYGPSLPRCYTLSAKIDL